MSRPIICFVHVPKTAGSTVNSLLQAQLPNGVSQAHALLQNHDQLAANIDGLDWISAHMPFGKFRNAVHKVSDRPRLFYSLLRDPAKQVMSHYNWLIEIHHRGDGFYRTHPPQIQRISETIRAADNTDPTQIIALLRRHRGLFLDVYARYILPASLKNPTEDDLLKTLRSYRKIVTQDDIAALMRDMIGTEVNINRRVNESPYHFDPAVFQTPEMHSFLATENALDQRIYTLVREGRAQKKAS